MEREEQRLARFIADLALQPDKLVRYMKDPEAAMQAAGLNEEERGVLGTRDFHVICDYLLPAGERPAPNPEPVGPPG